MDRRERIENMNEMLLAAMQGWQTDIWTALPGIVQSFDPIEMTCVVQPTVRFRITEPALNTYSSSTMIADKSGQFAWDKMPLLLDCPVVFPSGGGLTITFPIALDDEVLVVFASRCIDAWWQQGGIQNQAAFRMHDLSDGFVLPGVRSRSQARVLTNVSTDTAQFRTDDGLAYVDLHPTTHKVRVMTPSDAIVNAGNDVLVTSGRDMIAMVGRNLTAGVTGSVSVTAGGNITANASGNVAVQAGGTLSASSTGSASITAPTIALNGNVTIAGTIAQTGGGTGTFSGSIVATGNVTGAGISLNSHTHSGVQSGGSNTGGPQ